MVFVFVSVLFLHRIFSAATIISTCVHGCVSGGWWAPQEATRMLPEPKLMIILSSLLCSAPPLGSPHLFDHFAGLGLKRTGWGRERSGKRRTSDPLK